MATKIIIKNSSLAGKEPDPGVLEVGELAVNLVDQKLYTKDSGGNVFELGKEPVVDLDYTAGVSIGVITNTAGDDATIPLAGAVNAGLFSATEKDKLANIEEGAQVNVPGETPSGGTADRPTSPNVGDLFYDTDLGHLLFWNGTGWEQLTSEAPGTVGDYVKLDDGGTKQVIKRGGLGISNGTTENITLGSDGSGKFENGIDVRTQDGKRGLTVNSSSASNLEAIKINANGGVQKILIQHDGSASFAGAVKKDTFDNTSDSGYGWRLDNGSNFGQFDIDCASTANDDTRVFGVYKGTNNTIKLEASGSATFVSDVQVGGSPVGGVPTNVGTTLDPTGAVIVSRASGDVFLGKKQNTGVTSSINADGSATFSGEVRSSNKFWIYSPTADQYNNGFALVSSNGVGRNCGFGRINDTEFFIGFEPTDCAMKIVGNIGDLKQDVVFSNKVTAQSFDLESLSSLQP